MLNLFHWLRPKFNDPVYAYQIYQTSRYLISMITAVIMVKSGMPLKELGNYELIIFIVSSFSYFWSVGIKNALISFYPTVEAENQDSILQTVFWLMVSIGFFIGLLIMILPGFLSSFFINHGRISYFPLAGIYLFVSAPLQLTENVLLLRKDSKSINHYSTWSNGGSLIIAICVGYFYPTIGGFLYTLTFFSILRLLYLGSIIGLFRQQVLDLNAGRTFLIFSLPISINVLIGSAMDFIDGWFVTRYFDASTFAVFRYGARELPLSMVLFGSLSAAMIPVLMNGDLKTYELKRRATNLMHFMFPVAILMILVSPLIFSWIYSNEFRTSAFIFNIYLLVLTSRVLLPQSYNFALHQHKIIICTGIIEVVCNILLSYWWMQLWGIYGLALATVIAYFVQKVLLIVYNKVRNDISLFQYIDIRYYLMYSIFSFIAVYCTYKYYS